MSIEQLLPLLLFAGLALINFVVRLLRRRSEPTPPPETAPAPPRPAAPARIEVEPLPRRPKLMTLPEVAAVRRPPPPLAPPVPLRRGRVRLGGPADLRRAVVLLTILGPPAADDGGPRPT